MHSNRGGDRDQKINNAIRALNEDSKMKNLSSENPEPSTGGPTEDKALSGVDARPFIFGDFGHMEYDNDQVHEPNSNAPLSTVPFSGTTTQLATASILIYGFGISPANSYQAPNSAFTFGSLATAPVSHNGK